MDNSGDTLIQLLKLTSRMTEKVDNVDKRMDKIDKRMDKIESVVTNDVRQDQRLESIETSLKRGNEKFARIEERLNVLEDADGNKAKSIIHTVCNYLLTVGVTFIITCIGFYIMNKK